MTAEIRDIIREKIGTYSIHMSRVPKNTHDRFKTFASNEDFARDYGMALKFLLDFYEGLIPSGIEHLEVEIASLKEEIEAIKQQMKQEEKPIKKRLDGTGVEDGSAK